MKRNAVLKVIANALTKRNTGHYSYNETEHANLVLKELEDLDIIKPTHKKIVIRRDLELMPYEDTIIVDGWENE
jgi:NhaP-type Na+/H+ and K+/H+ antiporter